MGKYTGFGPTDTTGGWPDGEVGGIAAAPETLDPKKCESIFRNAYEASQCPHDIVQDGLCEDCYRRRRRAEGDARP